MLIDDNDKKWTYSFDKKQQALIIWQGEIIIAVRNLPHQRTPAPDYLETFADSQNRLILDMVEDLVNKANCAHIMEQMLNA